jgi:hypothetical protein
MNQVMKEDNEERGNYFQMFCKETTLHGWSYLNKDISRTRKVIWIAILFSIFSVSIWFIYTNVIQVSHMKARNKIFLLLICSWLFSLLFYYFSVTFVIK